MFILKMFMLGGGLALLLGGSSAMIRGAAAVARQLGIKPVIVGMVIVGFGTSAAELVVNLSAALSGSTDVAFGNIVGSNIGNIGLILGLAAIIRPLQIHPSIIIREIPMMLLASVLTGVLITDHLWNGGAGGVDQLGRADGFVLLLIFGVFLYYTLADALRTGPVDAYVEQTTQSQSQKSQISSGRAWLLTLGGLAGVLLGGHFTVVGAVELATRLGISPVVISLTIVAIGTSLPELATTISATRKNQSDLAVGNIVGSNIFNLLFILGLTCVIRPVQLPAGGLMDLLVMLGFSIVMLPLAMTHQRRIIRGEGALVILAYLGYLTYLLLSRL